MKLTEEQKINKYIDRFHRIADYYNKALSDLSKSVLYKDEIPEIEPKPNKVPRKLKKLAKKSHSIIQTVMYDKKSMRNGLMFEYYCGRKSQKVKKKVLFSKKLMQVYLMGKI